MSTLCLTGCSTTTPHKPQQRYEYVQLLMGVQVRLVSYATNEAVAYSASQKAFARVAELESVMSDYQTDSELMRLCRKSGQGPVPISKDLFEVLAYAQDVSARSDGAFDVTIGPLVKLWRQARKSQTLPTGSALADARSRVGWQKLKLDPEHQTAELTVKGMQLDLGGIGKGYAGDEAIRVLREQGVASALFEAGGDIVVSDPPPGKSGWEIETFEGTMTLHNAAISTSGDAVQYVEIAGVRYSHVLDPHTGLGLSEHYLATVIAPRGMTTDAVSTAATILGPGRGETLIYSFAGARGFIRKAPPTTSVTNP